MTLDRAIILARNVALGSAVLMAGALLLGLPTIVVLVAQFAFTASFFATFVLRTVRIFKRRNA